MKSDAELLDEYVAEGSEEAFSVLLTRHLDFVYSAALRQVGGDTHLAQDVSQLVFIDLARKASQLRGHAALTGWLYLAAHFAAAKASESASVIPIPPSPPISSTSSPACPPKSANPDAASPPRRSTAASMRRPATF